MKQVSYDKLLGISIQPENTCPLINALQFTGSQRTRIVRFKIDDFDDTAKIGYKEPQALYKTIAELNSWAEDVIDLYENLSDELQTELLEDYEILDVKTNLLKELDKCYIDQIETFIEEVNKEAEEVEEVISNYISKIEEIEEYEESINKLQQQYDDDEPEENEILDNKIDDINSSLSKAEKEKNDLVSNFKYVEISFDNKSDEFSDFLEVVRKRNENLRNYTSDLKGAIISVAKDKLELYQPIEYLNRTFKYELSEIVNLGVVKNTDNFFYTNLMKHLYVNNYINEDTYEKYKNVLVDYNGLKKEFFEEKYGTTKLGYFAEDKFITYIVNECNKKGYKGVRYYESDADFISNKDSYKTMYVENQKLKISKKI